MIFDTRHTLTLFDCLLLLPISLPVIVTNISACYCYQYLCLLLLPISLPVIVTVLPWYFVTIVTNMVDLFLQVCYTFVTIIPSYYCCCFLWLVVSSSSIKASECVSLNAAWFPNTTPYSLASSLGTEWNSHLLYYLLSGTTYRE